MQIYLAGKITAKPTLKLARKELELQGHTIVSRWLDYTDESMDDFKQKMYAFRDLDDIKKANCLILYTGDEPADGGGREVEWGYCISRMSLPLRIIVGPKRNVFHQLCTHQFQDWNECLAWLAKSG